MKIAMLMVITLLAAGCVAETDGETSEVTQAAEQKPCSIASQCDDGNACTTDGCYHGWCDSAPIVGCVLCNPLLPPGVECDDGNPCTGDRCGKGFCVHSVVGNCP